MATGELSALMSALEVRETLVLATVGVLSRTVNANVTPTGKGTRTAQLALQVGQAHHALWAFHLWPHRLELKRLNCAQFLRGASSLALMGHFTHFQRWESFS